MRYELESLQRGATIGSLVIVLDHHAKGHMSDESKAELLETFQGLTERAGKMQVFGLDATAMSRWGDSVVTRLSAAGADSWDVVRYDLLASERPDFLLQDQVVRGRLPATFGWALPASDASWLGQRLAKRAGTVSSTAPLRAMFPSMKRWAKAQLRSPANLVVEYGRFADAFRVFSAPPIPAELVIGLVGGRIDS